MREIKFRAKIKGDAGVYKVWAIDWLHQQMLIERACGDEWVSFDKIEASLQYTGLHDKNGKEIYDGDIVRGWRGTMYQIVWECPAYMAFDFKAWGEGYYDAYISLNDNEDIEVIGNIYKNPELLEG